MPELEIADWKAQRTELRSHLYRHHHWTTGEYGSFDVQQLILIHDAFHIVGFAMPHGHESPDSDNVVGEVIPSFSRKDIRKIIKAAIEGD